MKLRRWEVALYDLVTDLKPWVVSWHFTEKAARRYASRRNEFENRTRRGSCLWYYARPTAEHAARLIIKELRSGR